MENLLCRLTSERVLLRVHDILIKGNTKTKDQLIEAEIEALKTATTVQELIQAFTPSLSKIWVEPSGCIELVKHVKLGCPNLKFSGLMTIGMADYSSTPKNFRAVAGFMFEVMDKSVLFNPSQIVLTAGAASAIEMGCSLRNTEYIVRAVIFTGQETKVMMNSMNVPSKRSTLEKKLDKVILALFCLLFCMCLIGAICRIKTRVNWISSTLIRGLRIKTREDCISPVKKCFEGKDGLSYANILRSRNKFVDALAIYESVVEKDSKNVEAHIGKGICLHMQNMGRPAFESFAEAIRLDPQNACALTHCGIFYKDEGRLVEAAESYEKALRANSSYKPAAECLSIVLTDLGTSLKLAGNTQEGIQKYYEAIKIDQHYAPAYYNLGVVYSEMMQYDMALNCYEKAALERPMYAEAYCNMGVIYKNRGDLESVIAYYERCLAISPNFEIAKNNMAIALTDLGTKVVSSFTQILKWDYVVSSYDLPNLVLSRE